MATFTRSRSTSRIWRSPAPRTTYCSWRLNMIRSMPSMRTTRIVRRTTQVSFLSSGATSIPVGDFSPSCTDITTEIGITGTPVINTAPEALYVVAATKESGNYVQRLHALSLTTGAEQANSPVAIQASVPTNSGGSVTFSPLWQNQRAGLAFTGGGVFIAWSSHCDIDTWHGWLMRYDATTLAQTAVFNSSPNGEEGGIWMSGGAPAFDSSGNLYVTTGNGTFDDSNSVLPPLAPNDDFSMSFLKSIRRASRSGTSYTPSNEYVWSSNDWGYLFLRHHDIAGWHRSGWAPELARRFRQAIHLWLDRSDRDGGIERGRGQRGPRSDAAEFERLRPRVRLPTPGYHNGTVYIAYSFGSLMALPLANGLFSANAEAIVVPSSLSTEIYDFPSPTPSIFASPAATRSYGCSIIHFIRATPVRRRARQSCAPTMRPTSGRRSTAALQPAPTPPEMPSNSRCRLSRMATSMSAAGTN